MEIEIAEMSRMSERGSSLLRLIQNGHTPTLDLLIRESIQNSLDASREKNKPVKFDISVKDFEKDNVTRHFDVIGPQLSCEFTDSQQKSIVVRDSNTTGLTGPLHHDYIENNHYGNLLKLIYEISMPQEKKEAGGSWGLGKTIYFRVGIGLVVYYTRIKLDSGEYESRLAACLVEDEEGEDALLPPNDSNAGRGIAWWGQKHSEGSTMPLTDETKIHEILYDLNVEPYTETETGTTVIIPFIDTDGLIARTDDSDKLWWHTDIEYYLKIALQRWYAPRIDNPSYQYGNYMEPSVNGRKIDQDNMEPVFSILRSLYIAAQHGNEAVESSYIDKNSIDIKEIMVQRDLKPNVAGKVAFVKADMESLRMTVPNNKRTPFEYLDLPVHSGESNPPIVTYLRRPAMIINYETEGKWANGVEHTSEEEYIIAIFVPDSERVVETTEEKMSLDEFLRKGEKADHSSWSDIMLDSRKYTIVERIQKRVSEAIRNSYNKKTEDINASRSGALSKSLAKSLLPPSGFGKSPSTPERTNPGAGNLQKRKRAGKLDITGTRITPDGKIVVDFEILIPENAHSMVLEIQVDSEGNRRISGNEWENEDVIGTRFPIDIKEVKLLKPEESTEIKTNFIRTEKFNINHKIKFDLEDYQGELSGEFMMKNYDSRIQANIQHELKLAQEV